LRRPKLLQFKTKAAAAVIKLGGLLVRQQMSTLPQLPVIGLFQSLWLHLVAQVLQTLPIIKHFLRHW
jgi:hypothetical protein